VSDVVVKQQTTHTRAACVTTTTFTTTINTTTTNANTNPTTTTTNITTTTAIFFIALLQRSIEADRENLRGDFEQLRLENDRLVEELDALSDKLNREGDKVPPPSSTHAHAHTHTHTHTHTHPLPSPPRIRARICVRCLTSTPSIFAQQAALLVHCCGFERVRVLVLIGEQHTSQHFVLTRSVCHTSQRLSDSLVWVALLTPPLQVSGQQQHTARSAFLFIAWLREGVRACARFLYSLQY
jgi:hypothetical protein